MSSIAFNKALLINKIYPKYLNNFVLYRNLEDGKFITLDVEKFDPPIAEEEFTGIIIPEYASSTLRQNASAIVSKLKQDGIIED